MKHWLAGTAASLVLLAHSFASADEPSPTRWQWTAGPDIGVAGENNDGKFWGKTTFHMGARGDVLFGRSRNSSWGVGPGFAVNTNGFDDLHINPMLAVLVPTHDAYPFILYGGAYARLADSHWTPGVSGTLYWGNRSFNYSGRYVLSAGLVAEYKQGLGDPREHSLLFAFHMDGEFAIIPALFVINLFRGEN